MTELKTCTRVQTRDAMSRRFVAAYGMLMLYPSLTVAEQGGVFKNRLDINVFSSEEKREIREFATSYTQRMLVCGNENKLWIIAPSIFPSSGFCPAVELYARPRDALRVLRELGGRDIAFSKHMSLKPSRISPRLDALKAEISELLCQMRTCFSDIFRLDRCKSREEALAVITEQCDALAYFTGCPIELDISDQGGSSCFKVDLPVLSAFLMLNFVYARNIAPLRSASVEMTFKGEGASVNVRFESDRTVCLTDACIQMAKCATDKGMYIYFSHRDGYICSSLCPVRDERAYTEIKQLFNMSIK